MSAEFFCLRVENPVGLPAPRADPGGGPGRARLRVQHVWRRHLSQLGCSAALISSVGPGTRSATRFSRSPPRWTKGVDNQVHPTAAALTALATGHRASSPSMRKATATYEIVQPVAWDEILVPQGGCARGRPPAGRGAPSFVRAPSLPRPLALPLNLEQIDKLSSRCPAQLSSSTSNSAPRPLRRSPSSSSRAPAQTRPTSSKLQRRRSRPPRCVGCTPAPQPPPHPRQRTRPSLSGHACRLLAVWPRRPRPGASAVTRGPRTVAGPCGEDPGRLNSASPAPHVRSGATNRRARATPSWPGLMPRSHQPAGPRSSGSWKSACRRLRRVFRRFAGRGPTPVFPRRAPRTLPH